MDKNEVRAHVAVVFFIIVSSNKGVKSEYT